MRIKILEFHPDGTKSPSDEGDGSSFHQGLFFKRSISAADSSRRNLLSMQRNRSVGNYSKPLSDESNFPHSPSSSIPHSLHRPSPPSRFSGRNFSVPLNEIESSLEGPEISETSHPPQEKPTKIPPKVPSRKRMVATAVSSPSVVSSFSEEQPQQSQSVPETATASEKINIPISPQAKEETSTSPPTPIMPNMETKKTVLAGGKDQSERMLAPLPLPRDTPSLAPGLSGSIITSDPVCSNVITVASQTVKQGSLESQDDNESISQLRDRLKNLQLRMQQQKQQLTELS